MSFFGYMNSPISIPPVYDTTPCLEHMLEYEDWVIDTGVSKLEFFMPTWPTLWPGLSEGINAMRGSGLNFDPMLHPDDHPIVDADYEPLTARQKQLLYECEEERMVIKACLRELIKLKRSPKHTSWDTAEAANMAFM